MRKKGMTEPTRKTRGMVYVPELFNNPAAQMVTFLENKAKRLQLDLATTKRQLESYQRFNVAITLRPKEWTAGQGAVIRPKHLTIAQIAAFVIAKAGKPLTTRQIGEAATFFRDTKHKLHKYYARGGTYLAVYLRGHITLCNKPLIRKILLPEKIGQSTTAWELTEKGRAYVSQKLVEVEV